MLREVVFSMKDLTTYLTSVRERLESKQVRIIESWDKVTGEHKVTFPDHEADLAKLIAIVEKQAEALDLAKAQLEYLDNLFAHEGCDNSVVIGMISTAQADVAAICAVEAGGLE